MKWRAQYLVSRIIPMHFLNEVPTFNYFLPKPPKQTPNVSIHPESVSQVSLISKISKNSLSPGSLYFPLSIENLCLKNSFLQALHPTHLTLILLPRNV